MGKVIDYKHLFIPAIHRGRGARKRDVRAPLGSEIREGLVIYE